MQFDTAQQDFNRKNPIRLTVAGIFIATVKQTIVAQVPVVNAVGSIEGFLRQGAESVTVEKIDAYGNISPMFVANRG